MKRFLSIILSICVGLMALNAAGTRKSATEVMSQAAETLKKASAIEASFTAVHGGQSGSGQIIISGSKFKLTTNAMTTWFDGKTQWSYSPSAKEVNISEPTAEEVSQINPFSIISSLQTNFTPRRLNSAAGVDKIELTPKKKRSDYAKIIITFNATTLYPTDITITSTDGSSTAIKVTAIKKLKSASASTFRFNAKQYPGVEMIDLR